MKEVMGFLARDTLVKASTSFRFRIEALFTADGIFIEYVDCQCVSLLIFSCVVSFKRKKKKIPDLSLPPCIFPGSVHISNGNNIETKAERKRTEAVFLKLLWSPGIDFKEVIPPAYALAGLYKNLFQLGS